mmetsp:Transcript_49267/g.145475  ORF Transcript_49267/g.145475 Transcript_49267/m.145475 type:complete len:204 (+) Transcript_49267:569-1180(+)
MSSRISSEGRAALHDHSCWSLHHLSRRMVTLTELGWRRMNCTRSSIRAGAQSLRASAPWAAPRIFMASAYDSYTGEKRSSTVMRPFRRTCTESSMALTPSTDLSSASESASVPATARTRGGSHLSCAFAGRPFRKKTTSASTSQPEIEMPLPTEPPFTARATFMQVACEMPSTSSPSACTTRELKDRLQILLCRSRYGWLSTE